MSFKKKEVTVYQLNSLEVTEIKRVVLVSSIKFLLGPSVFEQNARVDLYISPLDALKRSFIPTVIFCKDVCEVHYM